MSQRKAQLFFTDFQYAHKFTENVIQIGQLIWKVRIMLLHAHKEISTVTEIVFKKGQPAE